MSAGPLLSDLDGTIADTASAIFAAMHVACAEVGVDVDPSTDLAFTLGPPLHDSLRQLGVAEEEIVRAISCFEQAHTDRLDMVKPMPGAAEAIGELVEAGVAVGVATIKPQAVAELVLHRVGLRDHVSVVCGRTDDLDPRTKTDLLRSVAAELDGTSPVYVGDHDNDEEAAAALGIRFFRFPDRSWAEVRDAVMSPVTR